MQHIVNGKHCVRRQALFLLLGIQRLHMLRKELIQAHFPYRWYDVQAYDLLVPLVASWAYALLVDAQPILKVLRYCLAWLRHNLAWFPLPYESIALFTGFLLCGRIHNLALATG